MDQNDLHQCVGRIESKVDRLLQDSADFDKRVRSLESTRTWLKGMWAAVVAAWGAILYTITQLSK